MNMGLLKKIGIGIVAIFAIIIVLGIIFGGQNSSSTNQLSRGRNDCPDITPLLEIDNETSINLVIPYNPLTSPEPKIDNWKIVEFSGRSNDTHVIEFCHKGEGVGENINWVYCPTIYLEKPRISESGTVLTPLERNVILSFEYRNGTMGEPKIECLASIIYGKISD